MVSSNMNDKKGRYPRYEELRIPEAKERNHFNLITEL